MPTIKDNIIRFDSKDWLSGLASHIQNIEYIAESDTALVHTVAMNPYRALNGYASPGFLPSDATNVSIVDAALKSGVVHGANAYFTSAGAKLHQYVINTQTLTTPTTFPYTITDGHASPVGEDVVVYSTNISSVKTARLFFSYNDGTDGNVGTYDFSTTFDPDFMSTIPASGAVLTAGKKHPMVVGANDRLYIGNGNLLAELDGGTGANGTYNASKLTLPKDLEIVSFAKIEPRSLVIFAYRSGVSSNYRGESYAFFWDYTSSDPYRVSNLNDNRVGAAFEFNGTIGCFTQGRANVAFISNTAKLKIWNGSYFETVRQFADTIPDFGGVDITGDTIVWQGGGNVYSYGNTANLGTALHKFAAGAGTTNGLCFHASNNNFLVSSGTTTSGGAQYFNTGYDLNAYLQTVSVRPRFVGKQYGKIKFVKTKFGTITSAGRGLDLKLNTDSNQTVTTVFSDIRTIIKNTSTPATNESIMTRIDSKDSSNNDFPEFADISLILDWSSGSGSTQSPVVDYVELHMDTRMVTEK